MKKLFILVIAVLFSAVAFAQNIEEVMITNRFLLEMKNMKDINKLDDINKYYDGSILLYDDWQPAVITMKSGKEERRMMNYFIYDNSFIYMQGRDSIITLAVTDRIKDIRIGNQVFETATYTDPKGGSVSTGVFEVVYKGVPMSIVRKYNIEFKKGQDGSGYKSEERPAILTKSVLYYQPINTTFSYPVPAKKKEFYSIFGDKAKDVEAYAKKNKLKTNEAGLIKMAEYYNTLE